MKAQATMNRVIDLVGAIVVLILLSPVLALLAIAIRVTMGAPVFFCQRRPGWRGQPFRMYKFRTMLDLRDEDGKPLPDEKRMTRFGRFLRSTSFDELPELVNVLRGEMSLVGPRPLLMQYLDRYTPEQARRHDVKPGVTGWAQVNGRNALGWDEKLRLDVWYVDHCNVRLDLKIMFLTLLQVLKRSGIHAAGHVSMPEFQGSSEAQREAA